jgi:prepilin-type N-terminal cleavage/methylation domain-containing protein
MYRTHRNGFTIIEVLVVIVIMVILLTLGVVGLTSQQKNARDNERRVDAENIARGIERYYNDTALGNGKYPDLSVAATIVSTNLLPGVDVKSYAYSFNSNLNAFIVASSVAANTLVTDISAATEATANTIVYLPMTYSVANSRWQSCTSGLECTRYVLHYGTETLGTVTLKSRQQQ